MADHGPLLGVWTGQDLEPQLPGTEIGSPLIDSIGGHHEFATAAARYLVVPGLLRVIANELAKRGGVA